MITTSSIEHELQNSALFLSPPKYHNKKIEYDGMKFDSKKEYRRYMELKLLERAGQIKNLECQVKYELIPSQKDENGKVIERACNYIADFQYFDVGENRTVVEDVKGYKGNTGAYNVYAIKRKIMLEKYGIRIKEI